MSRELKVCSFVKYGLMDSSGKVFKEAIFDKVLISDFWVVVKEKGEWKDMSDLLGYSTRPETFKEVELFDDVLWFSRYGKWGAMDATRNIVVSPNYIVLSKLENSSVLMLVNQTGELEYFSVKGRPVLPNGVEKFEIDEFFSGYAMARGYDKSEGETKFFVVDEFGKVFEKDFDDSYRCRDFLQDLRNDYVWSKNAVRRR